MMGKKRTRSQQRKDRITGRVMGKTVILIIMSTVLISCGKKDKLQEEILVGAAASLEPVIDELQTIYLEQNPNITITFTFAASGALEQQIREGAPIDVFLSAAEKQMDALAEEDLILKDTRMDFVENRIVLIVPKDSELKIDGFEDVLEASIIALGNPDSVPIGQYAQEIYESFNMLEEVYEKTTFAKDVSEVLAWVSSGNADAGVVYATDAALSDDIEIVALAPEGSHSRVIYPAAVIRGTKEETVARDFISFLGSDEAKVIFETYGFETIE